MVASSVARISSCYRGKNGSLMPIGHKGRFLLMVKMQKNETEITKAKLDYKLRTEQKEGDEALVNPSTENRLGFLLLKNCK